MTHKGKDAYSKYKQQEFEPNQPCGLRREFNPNLLCFRIRTDLPPTPGSIMMSEAAFCFQFSFPYNVFIFPGSGKGRKRATRGGSDSAGMYLDQDE